MLPKSGTLNDYLTILSKVRNWPFTTATVLDAALDLLRRKGQQDAIDLWPDAKTVRIPVGISLGLFPSPKIAVSRVHEAHLRGYRRIKLKIHPGMDTDTIAAVRSEFPNMILGFDANGSGTAGDLRFFQSLASFAPVMLEQPFALSRLDLCQQLRQQAPELRICLDESIASFGDLLTAHQLRTFDEINLKPGRVGGQLETVRILHFCAKNNVAAWVGGMFETGIGRSANLRVAALLPHAQAHDLSPGDRYYHRDVLMQPITMDKSGTILWQKEPPELDEAFIDEIQVQKIELTKD
ncbi:MAG: enolase C-terminal domain-like protein [bacterium]